MYRNTSGSAPRASNITRNSTSVPLLVLLRVILLRKQHEQQHERPFASAVASVVSLARLLNQWCYDSNPLASETDYWARVGAWY